MTGLIDCDREVGFFSNCSGNPLESFKHGLIVLALLKVQSFII